jgi:hypothetical protein
MPKMRFRLRSRFCKEENLEIAFRFEFSYFFPSDFFRRVETFELAASLADAERPTELQIEIA